MSHQGNFILIGKYEIDKNSIIDLIKNSKNTNFIYNHLSEFFHPFTNDEIIYLNDILKKNNSIFYTMVSCDRIEEKYSNFNLLYFPTFLLKKSYFDSNNQAFLKIKNYEEKFDSLFLFLNSNPRPHRYMAMDYLSKYNLLERGNFSWLKKYYYTDYKLKYWKECITTIDYNDVDDSSHIETFWNPVLFKNPFIKLVGETLYHDETFYLTEKTSMPILLGQPFLTISTLFFYKNLKKMGFKLYDEIFDYSFDNEINHEKRINMIIENIDKIKNKNLNELYIKIKNKVKYNQILSFQMINNDYIYHDVNTFEFIKKHKSIFKKMMYDNKIESYTFSHGVLDEKK